MKKIFTSLLLISMPLFWAKPVSANTKTEPNQQLLKSVYQQGKSRGILDDNNSSETEFIEVSLQAIFTRLPVGR